MKILLVDDSKSARYALRLQLQRHGLEVDTAESAEAAFEVLRKSLPDAILMDHMMPGLNGFEALEVIREDPRTASIPVIMCTSHEEPDFVATAKKKGVFGILPKSAAPELLPEILDKLRAKLGASVEKAPAETRGAPAQPAAAAGLSEEAVIKLIEARLEARLSRIMPPLMDEIRRDLNEGLLNESQRLIEERFAAEQSAQRAAPPKPTMADLQAISTRLATETLPDLIKRGIEAERASLLESLEKHMRDLRPRGAGAHGQEGHLESGENAAKAAAAARRETQEAIESALSTSQQSLQAVETSLRGAMGRIYTLVALAALAGIGAAAAVYFLLQA
ncbi:response regulator [Imhoffiella purpurea]|uniref:Twitching motility protein PilH n=1 Tax=Imhoffiella purpurea TaxID=1249627 RepID=W9V8E8_9GAMM|nr:response regulator [Imhoffiella purpurea]EXJ15714.1 twitching motility protein PilH [Imhoffiella purpurea]